MEATLKSQKVPVYIEEEMRESFMAYAMSVIISRALPDVRDGLWCRCGRRCCRRRGRGRCLGCRRGLGCFRLSGAGGECDSGAGGQEKRAGFHLSPSGFLCSDARPFNHSGREPYKANLREKTVACASFGVAQHDKIRASSHGILR